MDEVIWRGGLRTRLTRDRFYRWVGSGAYDAVPLASKFSNLILADQDFLKTKPVFNVDLLSI